MQIKLLAISTWQKWKPVSIRYRRNYSKYFICYRQKIHPWILSSKQINVSTLLGVGEYAPTILLTVPEEDCLHSI